MKAGKQSTKLTKCTKKVYFCRFTSFPTSRWERKVMDTRFIKRLISRIGFSSQAVAYVPNQRLGTRFKAHEVHEESVFLQIYLVPNVPLGTQGYGHPFHQTANFPNRFFIPSIPTFPIRDWERDLKHTKCTKKVYFCRFTSFTTSLWERGEHFSSPSCLFVFFVDRCVAALLFRLNDNR